MLLLLHRSYRSWCACACADGSACHWLTAQLLQIARQDKKELSRRLISIGLHLPCVLLRQTPSVLGPSSPPL
jgi:hypothetical protein